jgi:hypothetical protein
MDYRKLNGVDIVHDVEKIPYPLPEECCHVILASHLVEHIKPWLFMGVMDEWWRLLKVSGQLQIACPYGVSPGFLQDPTHCSPFTEATFIYFDPRAFLYEIYRPKPFKILTSSWFENGNMEVVLEKMDLKEGIKVYKEARFERSKQGVKYGND